jgi:peptidylprolyl isomerase
MKYTALILLLAASSVAASAQPPVKPAAPAAKPAVVAAKPAVPAAKPAVAAPATLPTIAAVIKAPAGIPPVPGVQKSLFTVALRYQEVKVGTGAVAETGKLYKVLYTGWRAADGVKFDSTDDHPRPPVLDKDGKPELGADGKPKQGPPQPAPFPQGMGGTIMGFDQGFAGMKIGGKRRIFIPWQLAYGTRSMPDRGPDHPGIPAKADLIFDVELVDVMEMPAPQARPGMMPGMRPMPNGQQMPPRPGTPGAQPVPGAAPKPPVAAAPAQPATPPDAKVAPTPTAPVAPAPPQPK